MQLPSTRFHAAAAAPSLLVSSRGSRCGGRAGYGRRDRRPDPLGALFQPPLRAQAAAVAGGLVQVLGAESLMQIGERAAGRGPGACWPIQGLVDAILLRAAQLVGFRPCMPKHAGEGWVS